LLGFLNLILGILGVVLLLRYRISHKAWLVHIISAISILSYLGPVIFDNTVGTIVFFEILEHVIFIAMVISGITMLKDMRNIKQGDSNEKDQPHLCFRSPGN
jgi:predicted membrane protein